MSFSCWYAVISFENDDLQIFGITRFNVAVSRAENLLATVTHDEKFAQTHTQIHGQTLLVEVQACSASLFL